MKIEKLCSILSRPPFLCNHPFTALEPRRRVLKTGGSTSHKSLLQAKVGSSSVGELGKKVLLAPARLSYYVASMGSNWSCDPSPLMFLGHFFEKSVFFHTQTREFRSYGSFRKANRHRAIQRTIFINFRARVSSGGLRAQDPSAGKAKSQQNMRLCNRLMWTIV